MKVAIIGRGFGANAMKPGFEAAGWEVDLIPSREADAVAAACKGDADLIAVHSPPFQHREHVLMAIDAGKDILCDKPFGKNGAEAVEMRDVAKAAGVLHFVNFEFRHDAVRSKVAELIGSGAIGRPRHATYRTYNNFTRKRDHGWLNDASLGGGWLGALGSHIVDMMRWQLGSDVADCGGTSRLDVPVRPGEGGDVAGTAEDAFAFWMTFTNGATATVESASATAVNLPPQVAYLGSEGAIEVTGDNNVVLHRPGEDPQVFEFDANAGAAMFGALGNWIAAIEEAIKTRTQIIPSFDEGVAVGEVMDKLKAGFVRPPVG